MRIGFGKLTHDARGRMRILGRIRSSQIVSNSCTPQSCSSFGNFRCTLTFLHANWSSFAFWAAITPKRLAIIMLAARKVTTENGPWEHRRVDSLCIGNERMASVEGWWALLVRPATASLVFRQFCLADGVAGTSGWMAGILDSHNAFFLLGWHSWGPGCSPMLVQGSPIRFTYPFTQSMHLTGHGCSVDLTIIIVPGSARLRILLVKHKLVMILVLLEFETQAYCSLPHRTNFVA